MKRVSTCLAVLLLLSAGAKAGEILSVRHVPDETAARFEVRVDTSDPSLGFKDWLLVGPFGVVSAPPSNKYSHVYLVEKEDLPATVILLARTGQSAYFQVSEKRLKNEAKDSGQFWDGVVNICIGAFFTLSGLILQNYLAKRNESRAQEVAALWNVRAKAREALQIVEHGGMDLFNRFEALHESLLGLRSPCVRPSSQVVAQVVADFRNFPPSGIELDPLLRELVSKVEQRIARCSSQ